MSKIVIVGSISMDLVMKTNRIAQEGETVFGDSFAMVPGGKGANQAVAVGRLAAQKIRLTCWELWARIPLTISYYKI